MRIGIDASSILPIRTGVGNYTLNLLNSLLRVDENNEYIIFMNSYSQLTPELPFLKKPNVKVKRFHIIGPLLLHLWRFFNAPPIELFVNKVDIFHSPAGIIIPQLKGKRVVTIHDLYFMEHPENTDFLGGRYLYHTLPHKIHKVDKIIAVSHSTKSAIVKYLKVPPEKITVIYEGVDFTRFRRIYDKATLGLIREEYCLPSQFILTVTTIEPRKNIEGLLFAYRRLKQILNNPPKLVVVGRKGLKGDKITETIHQLGLYRDVIFTGYVSDDHLPLIYNNALVFVFPSLSEGFGLPVLEAMACGLPVVSSDIPALREIASDVAVFVDPTNYYLMAEKLKELIISHKLRHQLQEKSLQQARHFSWESCARKTLHLYKEITLGVRPQNH
ncbi:glycosyltransferase family 4 protein [Candidatus Sumerlaeota bacterium]|nr:glycosyltransferase family 4 protein [Candidatus Sumerlaeota bacterium]